MSLTTKTVFIVDDDPSVRKAVTRLLKSAGYYVLSFPSAQEFLDSNFSAYSPACVVLDLKMPGLGGLDIQEIISKMEHTLPIIFISGHGDIPSSVRAMKKGAIDFLPKPFDDKNLLDAIQVAMQKDSTIRRVENEKKKIQRRIDTLTPRELQILTYVLTGKLNKQIADSLSISEKTVKVHRARVMEKMKVNSVAELVRCTEKIGIKPAE